MTGKEKSCEKSLHPHGSRPPAGVLFCGPVLAGDGSEGAGGVALAFTEHWLRQSSRLVFAKIFYNQVMAAPAGNETMIEIASHVREGAYAYLFRQYRVVTIVFVVLVLIFVGLAAIGVQNPFVPVAFLTGGFFSGLCGFLGMKTATNASSRTAQGASESLNRGLQVAFRSGAVMGLVVVGFGLLDISLWYLILDKLVYTEAHMRDGCGGSWCTQGWTRNRSSLRSPRP